MFSFPHNRRRRAGLNRCAAIVFSAYLIITTANRAVNAFDASTAVETLPLCAPLPPVHSPANSDSTTPPTSFPCRCSPTPDYLNLRIDCESAQLNDTAFTAASGRLDATAAVLLLSSNLLAEVPALRSDRLQRLDLSHNLIVRLYDNTFRDVGTSLTELVLSWNQIEGISINAFDGLAALRRLDLTKNHLARLANNVFSPMPRLQWLDVSRNRRLNETFAGAVNLYLTLGVSTRLETLRAEECGLRDLRLDGGVGLRSLHLKYNRFERVPDVPRALRVLDVSGNPMVELHAKSFPPLNALEELYVQDMPNLTTVGEWSLAAMPTLRRLSLSGSWLLRRFDATAMGWAVTSPGAEDVTADAAEPALSVLDLSGTALRGLNGTVSGTRLEQLLPGLQTLDLMGAPVVCDCRLKRMLELVHAGNGTVVGECVKPAELRGRRLIDVEGDEWGCRRWSPWVYQVLNGLAILAMLCVCVTATWCLVTHIRPRTRRERLQKVGDTSPYARVTIEPNLAEM